MNTILPVRLKQGGVLAGSVRSDHNGPLSGVEIHVTDTESNSKRLWMAMTDQRGEYRIDSLPLQNNLLVTVMSDGYNSVDADLSISEGTKEKDFTLSQSPRLAGRVIDENGDPVTGANVYISSRSSGIDTDYEVTTDEEGRFASPYSDPDDGEVTVAITHEDFNPAFRKFSEADLKGSIELQLEEGYRYFGRVVDERGDPIRKAVVWPQSFDASSKILAWTDEDGFFETPTTHPMGTRFIIFKRNKREHAPVDLEPMKKMQDIVLEDPWMLKGRVIDVATRKPIDGFALNMRPKTFPGVTPVPMKDILFGAGDGTFELEVTQGGVYELEIKSDGYQGKVVEILINETFTGEPLDIQLATR